MPQEGTGSLLGDECSECEDACFSIAITEEGSGDIETESGESIRTESGYYLRTE